MVIHGFRDSVLVRKMHGCYLGYGKISSNFSFLSKRYKAITVCWCKNPTSNSFQMCLYCLYLFKLYDKSIIILPTNDLTNICSEISEIRLILWMVYTCNERPGWRRKVGWKWMYFASLTKITNDEWLQHTIPSSLKPFSR